MTPHPVPEKYQQEANAHGFEIRAMSQSTSSEDKVTARITTLEGVVLGPDISIDIGGDPNARDALFTQAIAEGKEQMAKRTDES